MRINNDFTKNALMNTLFGASDNNAKKSKEQMLLSSLGNSNSDALILSSDAQRAMLKAKYSQKMTRTSSEADVGKIDSNIQNGDIALQQAITSNKKEFLDMAVSSYKASLAENDKNPLGYDRMGTALLKKGENDEAIKNFETAVKLAPNNTKYLNNLGAAYYVAGDFDKASQVYEKSQKIDSTNMNSLIGLAKVASKQEDSTKAHKYLQKASGLSPTDPSVLTAIGKFYEEQGDVGKAKQYYKAVSVLQPNNIGNTLNKYKINHKNGKS